MGRFPVGRNPTGWPKLTRKFPFVPVGNNPAHMAYQDNSFRNTLPKVSVAAQDFNPGQDRVYKVTISNISPEVDLGYYLDSVSIYNATSGEQAPFARNDVAGQYDKQDELVTRNADGTLTVEVEYKVHGDSSYSLLLAVQWLKCVRCSRTLSIRTVAISSR